MKKKLKKSNPSYAKSTALLIIDMINTLDFPEGRSLKRAALPAAKKIAQLKERFQSRKIPVIYVNDNFGEWAADWKAIYAKCAAKETSLGAELAEILKPGDEDFFILKPRHSGFHLTPLEALLERLGVKKLVITGIAGNICVLFTVHEAHMRGYDVIVPRDCIASNTPSQNRFAIEQLSKALKLKTPLSRGLP